MQSKSNILARPIALAVGAALALGTISTPADAAPRKKARAKAVKVVKPARPRGPVVGIQRPTGEIYLAKGRGQLVNLGTPIVDVFVSNNAVADVQVQSPTQIYIFGKDDGEASIYATTRTGQVAYSTNVRVAQNYGSLDQVLRLAMPDSDITATMAGQVVVLTGTVKSPEDATEAANLVRAYMNPGVNASDPAAQLKVGVINRLRTATPLQVTMHVRIAEVSRSFSKNFGVRWQADNGAATGGGTRFDITQSGSAGSTAQLSGRLLGLNVLSQLDVGESEGFVTTLASPNVTALSGEKATFLAGGEIPIRYTLTSNGSNTETIVFKPYGVTVDFMPTVLADGRISLVIKPEVSEIDDALSVGGIPAFKTRRVETTVELGSGQSFVIGGLMRADNSNTMDKMPFAGDVPILGALFRSNRWRRGESELMIVVTPYLVNPVPANKIILPTDGYQAPNELSRIFGGKLYEGAKNGRPNKPAVAPSITVPADAVSRTQGSSAAAPGFTN